MADLKKEERRVSLERKYVGVRKRNSKYTAELRDFRKKKRVWLGTFNTPEEASFVYLSKKREIDESKSKLLAKNIPSQNPSETLDSPSHVLHKRQVSDKNGVSDGTSSHSAAALEEQVSDKNEDSDETRSRSAAPVEEQVFGKNEVSSDEISRRSTAALEEQVSDKNEVSDETSSRSAATMEEQVSDKNEVSDGTNSRSAPVEEKVSDKNDVSDETSSRSAAAAMEEKVYGYQDDKFGFINGVQVFDEYGILVGEFSKIDDLSIICQPEDSDSIF